MKLAVFSQKRQFVAEGHVGAQVVEDVEMREAARQAVVGQKLLGNERSEGDVFGLDRPR